MWKEGNDDEAPRLELKQFSNSAMINRIACRGGRLWPPAVPADVSFL